MIERVVLAIVILIAILLAGWLFQVWSRRRISRAARGQVLFSPSTLVPQIVSFYGDHCDACQRQKAVIEELLRELPGRASVRFVDAAADYDESMRLGVVIVPTTFITRSDGEVVASNCGLASREWLTSRLADAVAVAPA